MCGAVRLRLSDQGFEGGPVVEPDVIRERPRHDLVEEGHVRAENPEAFEDAEIERPVGPPDDQVLHAARGHLDRDGELLPACVRLRDAEHEQRVGGAGVAADRLDEPAREVVRQRRDEPDAFERTRVRPERIGHPGAARPVPQDDSGRFELIVGAPHGHPARAG